MQFVEDLKDVSYEYYQLLVSYLPRIVLAFLVLFIALAIAGRAKRAMRNRLNRTMDDPLLADFLSQILRVC